MKRILFNLLLLLCFSLSSLSSAMALTTFTSHYDSMAATRAAWLDEIGITMPDTTIDFEAGFTQGQDIMGTVLDDGLSITSSSGGYGFVSSLSGSFGTSSPIGEFALALDEEDNYLFSFSGLSTYIGFYMFDQSATPISIHYADGTSESLTIGSGGANGHNGTFWGLVFDAPVISVYIPNLEGGDGEVGIDNIEFGAASPVPVPSALLLLGMGLLGLAKVNRKE